MSCASDRAILNSIFNPLLPVGEAVFDDDIPDDLEDEQTNLSPDLLQSVKNLELSGVKFSEDGDLQGGLKYFNQAVDMAPGRSSVYNNRAQVYRILGQEEEALQDLSTAIRVSEGVGRSAAQALTQRGLVRLRQGNNDAAREDFSAAAKLGSKFAKSQLAQLNPYAALCNKMLHQVFTQLQKGEQVE